MYSSTNNFGNTAALGTVGHLRMNSREPSGYRFSLTGQPTGVVQPLPIAHLSELQQMQGEFSVPVVGCGFAHEARIRDYTDRAQFDRLLRQVRDRVPQACAEYQNLIVHCLCPAAVRGNTPTCAHATSQLAPDPYGPSLRRLIELQVLQAEPWKQWHQQMVSQIREADGQAARSRYTLQGLLGTWHELQTDIIEVLESKRAVLLGCVGQVISDIHTHATVPSEAVPELPPGGTEIQLSV